MLLSRLRRWWKSRKSNHKARVRPSVRPRLEVLEDRTVPTDLIRIGTRFPPFVPLTPLSPPVSIVDDSIVVTGAEAGEACLVKVLDGAGKEKFRFFPFDPGFKGGVRVATGDVNGDGVVDIICAAGPGAGPHVKVFSGLTGTQLPSFIGSFFAFSETFRGGAFIAAGDVNRDGFDDLIVGADAGAGPHIKVLSGATGVVIASFFAFDPSFRGGARVACGDVNGDGFCDIIVGAGPGAGPHIKVFSGFNLGTIGSFFAFDPRFGGGTFITTGLVTPDLRADIIVGSGALSFGPPVTGTNVTIVDGATMTQIGGFNAFTGGFRVGARVSALDLTGDGKVEIITTPVIGGGKFKVFDSLTFRELNGFFINTPVFSFPFFHVGTRFRRLLLR